MEGNELEIYVTRLNQIQQEINRIEAHKLELIKEGLRLEGIIAYLKEKQNEKQNENINDQNKSE